MTASTCSSQCYQELLGCGQEAAHDGTLEPSKDRQAPMVAVTTAHTSTTLRSGDLGGLRKTR